MFDLNEQIKMWRDKLKESNSLKVEDICELESHLRDEIVDLCDAKLSDEEAFVIAVNRLGYIDSIIEEYKKVNNKEVKISCFTQIITGMLFYLMTLYFAKYTVLYRIQEVINLRIYDYNTLALTRFFIEIFSVTVMFLSGCLFFKYFIETKFMHVVIERVLQRLFLLICLLVFIIYRIGFHIPVPGFRGFDYNRQLDSALKYIKLFWLIGIPMVFVLLTALRNRNFTRVKTN